MKNLICKLFGHKLKIIKKTIGNWKYYPPFDFKPLEKPIVINHKICLRCKQEFRSEPIEKICKNCDYFQPIKNENGIGWCVFEVGIDKAKFGNETCADFSHT